MAERAGQPPPIPSSTDPSMDDALRALAEPRRREILRLVAAQELAAGEIAAAFDITRPAVSQHLTVLKHAGLLDERRDGTRRLYRARPEGLANLRRPAGAGVVDGHCDGHRLRAALSRTVH